MLLTTCALMQSLDFLALHPSTSFLTSLALCFFSSSFGIILNTKSFLVFFWSTLDRCTHSHYFKFLLIFWWLPNFFSIPDSSAELHSCKFSPLGFFTSRLSQSEPKCFIVFACRYPASLCYTLNDITIFLQSCKVEPAKSYPRLCPVPDSFPKCKWQLTAISLFISLQSLCL